MTDRPNTINQPESRDRRLGFIADLSFIFIVPWLCLWRFELPDYSRSIWTSWWPTIVVLTLFGVACGIGRAQRQPRGFLPYTIRWALLGLLLILPAWIAISIAEVRNGGPTLRGAAAEVRAEVEPQLGGASPAELTQLREMLVAAESVDKLSGVLMGTQGSRGLASSEPLITGETALPPAAKEQIERAIGLADAIEEKRALPPELVEEAAEAGMDEAAMLAAVLLFAAVLLAPALGLSSKATLMLLKALISSGELSVAGAMKVGFALASAALPGGGFDEAKVFESFDRVTGLARNAEVILQAAERAGGDSVKNSPLFGIVKKTARDLSAEGLKCFEKVDNTNPQTDDATLEQLLREHCRDLGPDDRKRAIKRRKRGVR